jgi:hypothetical protein
MVIKINKMKNYLKQIFTTKIGWAFISIILTVIFGIFSTHSTIIENGYIWCDYAMWFPLSYLLGLSVTMILFAWIINPIKKYLDKE